MRLIFEVIQYVTPTLELNEMKGSYSILVWVCQVFLHNSECSKANCRKTDQPFTNLRARAHQGNWQPQHNCNFRELLSPWVEHILLNGAAQIEETGNRNATVISENCCQPELNTCYWMKQRKLRKLATATQPQFPRTVVSLSWTHVTEWSSANWGNGNAVSSICAAPFWGW
jgi:hypothetical protein